ncbi:hypothetical protein [Candidatus Poriferisodalis sp.]|uniref:hypothetical protein n=1 Tax=Candidatus Poriferisodalis sp. TaxID=3101277 RepID=UPI003AF41465
MLSVPPDGHRPNRQRWVLVSIWVGVAMMLGSWLLEGEISSGSATALRFIGLGVVVVSVIPNLRKRRQWVRNARDSGLSRRETRHSTGLSAGYWVTMIVGMGLFGYLMDFVKSSPSDVGRVVIAVAVITVVGVVMGTRFEVVAAAARGRQGVALSGWWTSKAGIGTTLVLSVGAIIMAFMALLTWPDHSGFRIVAMIVVLSAGSGAGAAITWLRSLLAGKPFTSARTG